MTDNSGVAPVFISQSGNVVKICASSTCSNGSDQSFRLATAAKVSLSAVAPTSEGQIVVMTNEACNNNQLGKGAARDISIAYFVGGKLGCRQA